jgi:sugar phosphate isomerase/epimerase
MENQTLMSLEVTVRDAMVSVAPGQTFFEALRELEIAGFEMLVRIDGSLPGIVLEDGSAPFSLTDVAALKARLQDEGVHVCALLLGTDFGGENASEHSQWAIDAVRAAAELGAPAVRIDTATANPELSPVQMRDAFVRGIVPVLEATRDSGVDLGIENHGRISNDPEWLDATFAAVGDPRLGLTLDVGNLYWWGHPLSELYRLYEYLAPRARHTHIKSIAYPAEMRETRREIGYEYARYNSPVDEGDIDMSRVIGLLHKAGYQRTLCLENEGLGRVPFEERAEITRREARYLEKLQSESV